VRLVRPLLAATALGALVVGGSALAAPVHHTSAAHQPRLMRLLQSGPGLPLTPPAPPCPIPPGTLPAVPDAVPVVGGSKVGPCVKGPEFPAAGQPNMGNMAYWGGRVQVHPHVYLVYLGWGREDAFKNDCGRPVKLVEGRIKATLKCDPDGAGKRMADFVSQLGGTGWAGSQTQYYQVINGVKTNISNDKNQLAGIWVDDASPTSAKISYRDMAVEADRARKHFGIKDKDLFDSNVAILQPQNFSDPKAPGGYCAWHDIIEPAFDAVEFKGLKANLPFTNMPYVLNQGSSCGANLINPGKAGKLDGFTIALGHEIEEAVTDPGAEDMFGATAIGGWYDPFDGNENGDKCAYVGNSPFGGSLAIPGRGGNIKGNRGGSFPVQSLWSNSSAAGAGYCAGAGTDLPF
jgi:hypothetical protein